VMRMARARSVTPAILLDASRTLTDAVTKGQQDGTMTPKEAKFLLAEAKKLQTQAKKLSEFGKVAGIACTFHCRPGDR